MKRCSICNSKLLPKDTKVCEYCGKPICNKCVEEGKLLINDEMGIWMCPLCSKKSLEWDRED
ncbi:MAG: hypothetical protein EU547_06320 [Promethearchaeota archaeon]|nr:MAG: hypothetical protein EU547_06320 [Candidatus Lokiarchaeota archaeon]